MSLVEVKLKLEFATGEVVTATLRKTLAPLTIERLLRFSPYETRCYFFGRSIIYFPLNMKIGEERSTYDLKKGDVFYWLVGESLGIALEDVRFPQRVNLLGKLDNNIKKLQNLKIGTSVKISLEEVKGE